MHASSHLEPLVTAGPDPRPAGFPGCGGCAYRTHGDPATCFPCATARAAAPAGPRCAVCTQSLSRAGDDCPNTVCNEHDRQFSQIYTVSEDAEPMWDALCRYKYDEDRGWAQVLGRLLVGYLDDQGDELRRFDLITTGALYVGPRANRLWDHLRLVLDAARSQGRDWPFADDLITKSVPTGRFLGTGVEERRRIADGELRAALAVPHPERVSGRRVLVIDDVYSEGFSLREMARALREAGAVEVAGLVFARRKGG